jgi:hypothetical protein
MTDRELLELAAKAAGLPHQWCDAWNTMAKPRPDGGFFFDKVWNPLRDDGDALRLAVKLKIGSIEALRLWASVDCEAANSAYEIDPYAATRRAIVRAAAEIGRNT